MILTFLFIFDIDLKQDMTQQEISKLLDVPDRTLRDWKTNERSEQKVYANIYNYLFIR